MIKFITFSMESGGKTKEKKSTKSFSYNEIEKILRLKPVYVVLYLK